MEENLKETLFLSDYEKIKPNLIITGKAIDNRLNELLDSIEGFNKMLNLEVAPCYCIKSDESILKKAFYRNKKYNNPLENITDKVRTRVVVTSKKEQELIKNAIVRNNDTWSIVEIKDEYSFILDAERFSYCAVHILLKPREIIFNNNITDENLDLYVCEVQIKTLLQHAWAQISHDTIYKGEFEYDAELKRLMARSMALMEITDEYFINAHNHMANMSRNEKGIIQNLIVFSNEVLGLPFNFNEVDFIISKEIFNATEFQAKYSLENVTEILKEKRIEVRNAVLSLKSQLRKQPAVLLLMFFIEQRLGYKLKQTWKFEEDVLSEVFTSLGHSFQVQ